MAMTLVPSNAILRFMIRGALARTVLASGRSQRDVSKSRPGPGGRARRETGEDANGPGRQRIRLGVNDTMNHIGALVSVHRIVYEGIPKFLEKPTACIK